MDASSGNNTSNGKPLKCNQNVQVYLRVRPTNAREKLIRSQEVVDVVSSREVMLKPALLDTRTSKKFTFDRAFDVNSRQHEVYQAVVAPYIEEVLAGFNCTVFAYGQTGTGKTFTMVGEEQPELSSGWDDDTKTGIIPRALNHLFDELRMTELEFSMRISYLELYNEELCDLLSTDDHVKIRIYDDVNKKGSVIVQGLEEVLVHSKDDVYKLLAKGQERRRTASTLMNAQSSRSHTIFSIIVHIKENGMEGEELLKIGKLNLVDLAGSENITKAGNEKGIRTRESVNINQSLLTLGRVITALVERTPHIPYRESKLTRLLQESLGGRTKTSIIATISPGHKDFEETLSTLEYAHRAKNIQNKPEANQKLSKKTVIKEYTEEIDRLKRELLATRDKNGIYLPEETYNEMLYKSEATTKELNDKALLIKALKEDLAKKESIFREVSLSLVEKEEVLRKTEGDLCLTKHELVSTKRSLNKTKRRYAEKKVIIDRQVKTEETLTGQAKQLIEVVEDVRADTDGLHATIDRRKETDAKNRTVCEQFVDRMRTRMQNLQANVTSLTQGCGQITASIGRDWDKYLAQQEALQHDTAERIAALEALAQSELASGAALVESFQREHSEWTDGQLKVVESCAGLVDQAVEGLRVTLAANVEALRKILEEQRGAQRKLLESTLESCRRSDEQCLAFANAQRSNLREMDQLMVRFGESGVQIEQFVERSKESTQKRMDQLTAFYNAMCEEMRAEQAQLDTLKTVCQDVQDAKTAAQRLIATGETQVDESIRQRTASAEQLEENNRQLDEVLKMQRFVVEGCLKETILQPLEASCTTQQQSITQQRQTLQALPASSRTRWTQFSTAFATHNSNLSTSHTAQTNSLSEALASNRTAQADFHTTTVALNKQLQRTVSTYQNQTNANIAEMGAQIGRFHQNELQLYQPTGETPVRKAIAYPKDLAMTSPHERIVRRFWRERGMQELDLSSAISEQDNEDVSMLCASLNGDEIRNSTPLAPRLNVLDEDRKRFKDLQISNILSKVGNEIELEEHNKENMDTIEEVS
uniref:Putative kinesin-like protein n=1 Tax=Culex tarsalis TaxID=7177 RepID=A0A1Q3EX54_CULTA